MSINDEKIKDFIQKKVSVAKAAKGWGWEEISQVYAALGEEQSPNNLASKNSRGALKAQDFLLLLKALGVRFLDLSELSLPQLDEAVKVVEKKKK